MGFAISRYWPDARAAHISLSHPSSFGTRRSGPLFGGLPQIITSAPRGTSSWLVTRAFCADAWVTILGILLCVLTGPPALAEPNAKNVEFH